MTSHDWAALRDRVDGDLVLPDDPGYDRVRRPALPRYADARPQAVVRAETAADVAAALAFAGAEGLSLTPRSGGHCFAGRSSAGAIVVDVQPMAGIRVADGVVEVGAGVWLGRLSATLAGHGLALPTGCGVTVGIAGQVLGGGMGTLGRRYGLTCDRLVAARVVLADGTVLECDEGRDADLFWALRGAGGGQFGVVTSLRFRTVPEPTATAFHLTWPGDRAAAVVSAWQDWAPDAPDEVAAELELAAAPSAPAGVAVAVFGLVLTDGPGADRYLDDLVAGVGAPPAQRRARTARHSEAKATLAAFRAAPDGPGSSGGIELSKCEFFAEPLPAEAVDRLVGGLASAGGEPTGARHVTFVPWGGAYGRTATDATAFAYRDARFLVEHVAALAPTAGAEAVGRARSWLTGSWRGLRPWGTGGAYVNFPDPDLEDPLPAYHGHHLDRLRRVKRAYDPDGRFCFPQALTPVDR